MLALVLCTLTRGHGLLEPITSLASLVSLLLPQVTMSVVIIGTLNSEDRNESLK